MFINSDQTNLLSRNEVQKNVEDVWETSLGASKFCDSLRRGQNRKNFAH